MNIWLSLVVCIVGLVVYAISNNGKHRLSLSMPSGWACWPSCFTWGGHLALH